jgi:hypothetical protein
MKEEQLIHLSDDQLWQVYENCQKKRSDEALLLLSAIEALIIQRANVSIGETGVKLHEAFGKLMAETINSAKVVEAARIATDAGLPAMVGVEPFLISRFDLAYSKRFEATVQAGYLVGKMMVRLGFEKSGRKGPMPAGSVAKTAEIYLATSR